MTTHQITRRTFIGGTMVLGAMVAASAGASLDGGKKNLAIGSFIFPRMDQIDFTGPFSVLSRLPQSQLQVMALERAPIQDHKGLVLTPQITEHRSLTYCTCPAAPDRKR